MREIQSLEELHGILLDIAKEFHRICVKNEIPYYLAGGSMLGAIRHKGFIPWDDDFDIYVPRAYFSKLKNTLQSELPDSYAVRDVNDLDVLWGELMKVEDTKTVIHEKLGNGFFEHGAFIDIFPLDYTDNSKRPFSRNQIVRKLLMLHSVSKRKGSRLKNLVIKTITKLFGANVFIKVIKHVVKRKGDFLTNYSGAYGETECVLKEVIGNPTLYPFCDTSFYGVEQYDEYLAQIYGDYMQLPPEDKRRIHILKMFYKD